YEFLTLTYPFPKNDPAALMYSINCVDAPPLREGWPDCPESLDVIVHRAIAKDPALRYASMDEVLFELGAVQRDCSRKQAAQVMLEVMPLLEARETSQALKKLRMVVELDPSNSDARRLHDDLFKEKRHLALQLRKTKLLEEGEMHLQQRHFNKAVEL